MNRLKANDATFRCHKSQNWYEFNYIIGDFGDFSILHPNLHHIATSNTSHNSLCINRTSNTSVSGFIFAEFWNYYRPILLCLVTTWDQYIHCNEDIISLSILGLSLTSLTIISLCTKLLISRPFFCNHPFILHMYFSMFYMPSRSILKTK